MSHIDYERLSKIVGELDTLMPDGEAVARIDRRRERYGLVANQTACLRMGSEMLKAAAVRTPVADVSLPTRPSSRPRPVTRRKLPGLFGGDSAVQIERIERHDVLPIAPTASFSKKAFFSSMITAMSISSLTILGGIVAAIAGVDAYVIPNLGDVNVASAVTTPAYPAEDATASMTAD